MTTAPKISRLAALRDAVGIALGRFVRLFVPVIEWLMWQPVCLSNFVVDAMYRRKIAPHLYMPDNSPLRRLHIRLVKMWMPFFRGRPNTTLSRADLDNQSP